MNNEFLIKKEAKTLIFKDRKIAAERDKVNCERNIESKQKVYYTIKQHEFKFINSNILSKMAKAIWNMN